MSVAPIGTITVLATTLVTCMVSALSRRGLATDRQRSFVNHGQHSDRKRVSANVGNRREADLAALPGHLVYLTAEHLKHRNILGEDPFVARPRSVASFRDCRMVDAD